MDPIVNTALVDQILNELLSAVERAESQSAALVQFMKEKGIATEDDLAPYLEAAANASDIKGRAARLRMTSLINSAVKSAEELIANKIEQANHKGAKATPADKPRNAAEPLEGTSEQVRHSQEHHSPEPEQRSNEQPDHKSKPPEPSPEKASAKKPEKNLEDSIADEQAKVRGAESGPKAA